MAKSSPQSLNPFPSNKIIRKMGYSKDQDGIMNRYINEAGSWNAHLNNSKNFIVDAVKTNSPRTIAVLGSGWLLDVPIDFLAGHCDKVALFDIRHPRQIINKLKKYTNIEFRSMDITGGLIQYIYEKIRKKDFSNLDDLPEVTFTPTENYDYTVSLNLLNQLDILIIEYLRKFPDISNETINSIRKKIQLAHLNCLFTDKSCLISDYKELIFDRTGKLVEETDLVFNPFPKGNVASEWIWEFDNQMTYYPNRKTHFKVKAIQL